MEICDINLENFEVDLSKDSAGVNGRPHVFVF